MVKHQLEFYGCLQDNDFQVFFCNALERYAFRHMSEPSDVFYLSDEFDNSIEATHLLLELGESPRKVETLMGLLRDGVVFQ